jgi:hypothetical protein
MLTSAFATAPLIPKTGVALTSPMPLGVVARRPQVLVRPRAMPQQLSLFGPPGVIRR